MSESVPPPPTAPLGLAITAVIAFGVISWIFLGSYLLKFPSYFNALLVFWYWTTVGQSDFRRLPSIIAGALLGLGVTWAMRSLSTSLGLWGLGLGGFLIAITVLVDLMRWFPVAVNGSTTLFLTVAGIPLLMGAAHYLEAALALLIGCAYLSSVAWIAIWFSRRSTRPGIV